MPNTESTNDLAYYAELGFRVFPNHYRTDAGCSCKDARSCEKPGKHPAIKGYQNLASSEFKNLTLSRNLFGGKFRNHDIGGLTGFGFFVVDSDKGELEGLPETWKSKSANRGFHYFFKAPSGISIRNIKDLIPGVDIKGQRGYVVLPSEINNREWINSPHEAELADAPTWILEKIQHHQTTQEQVYSEISGGFDFTSATILEEGTRNETLFKYGCYLRACADRLATFRIWRFSERSNRLLIAH